MRIAVVGAKRPYLPMPQDVRDTYDRFHLELPWYYAQDGGNDVTVVTVDYTTPYTEFPSGGRIRDLKEDDYLAGRDGEYDVIIHWRGWHQGLHKDGTLRLMHTCDWAYPREWLEKVEIALGTAYLHRVLCHPTWHRRNTVAELASVHGVDWSSRVIDHITSGVDTEIYRPAPAKDPRMMLWASDPGRGLYPAIQLAIELFQVDRRFRLHVCHPDYARMSPVQHPAIVWHGFVPNGPKLQGLFNEASFLPYTSTFMEPSARTFRQAQASGQVVLYPPGMGSPSEVIRNAWDGVVSPVKQWKLAILDLVADHELRQGYSKNARESAVADNWVVQSRRFNEKIGKLLEEFKNR